MSTAAPPERSWALPDEPAPVRLMSTIWAGQDGIHDDLRTRADVDEWLDAIGAERAGTHATETELAKARALRDAVRRLAAFRTEDSRASAASAMTDLAEALDRVNSTAAELPVLRLALRDGRLEQGLYTEASPVTTGLAQVAEQSVELLGGVGAAKLRACYAPGCVLYFIKSHPRREWCSVTCGNRVRAARHYQRARGHQSDLSSEAGRAFHVPVVRGGEAEFPVEVVGVGRMQGPAESGARSPVDHRRHQFLAEAGTARVLEDEDVRQVAEGHAVRDRPGEADLAAGRRLVHTDDTPGRGQLRREVRAGAVRAPVRLRGQEIPHGVRVDPARVVVELVSTGSKDHPRMLTLYFLVAFVSGGAAQLP
jgi:predicted RNA-binding Zn ribbon-like protein